MPTGVAGERGYSLGELFPQQREAWRLTIRTAGGTRSLDGEDLGERLYDMYAVETAGGWDLVLDPGQERSRERLHDVAEVALQGEPCPEKAIEVWLSWEGVPELKAEIRSWAERAGVSAKVVDVPSIKSKLVAVLRGGGKAPDLVMVQSDYLPSFIAASSLQPLDGMDASRLSGKGRDAFTASGRIWALPFYFDAQLVFYNPALLSRRPARTWTLDDMEAEARLVAGSGRTPMAWNAYSAYWLLPFALGFGKAGIEDSDGAVRPDDAGTGKALSWLLRMRDEKLLAVLERDAMMGRFASGETAMILTASYSIPEFERLGIPFGIAAYPTVPETGSPVAPFLDFKGFAVTRASRSPITARRLAAHLTGSGVQQRFTAAVSKLPANSDAWELVRSANRYFPELERSAEIGVVVPSSESWSTYKNIMWKMLRFVFAGSMGVDEALAEARRLVDANFKN